MIQKVEFHTSRGEHTFFFNLYGDNKDYPFATIPVVTAKVDGFDNQVARAHENLVTILGMALEQAKTLVGYYKPPSPSGA